MKRSVSKVSYLGLAAFAVASLMGCDNRGFEAIKGGGKGQPIVLAKTDENALRQSVVNLLLESSSQKQNLELLKQDIEKRLDLADVNLVRAIDAIATTDEASSNIKIMVALASGEKAALYSAVVTKDQSKYMVPLEKTQNGDDLQLQVFASCDSACEKLTVIVRDADVKNDSRDRQESVVVSLGGVAGFQFAKDSTTRVGLYKLVGDTLLNDNQVNVDSYGAIIREQNKEVIESLSKALKEKVKANVQGISASLQTGNLQNSGLAIVSVKVKVGDQAVVANAILSWLDILTENVVKARSTDSIGLSIEVQCLAGCNQVLIAMNEGDTKAVFAFVEEKANDLQALKVIDANIGLENVRSYEDVAVEQGEAEGEQNVATGTIVDTALGDYAKIRHQIDGAAAASANSESDNDSSETGSETDSKSETVSSSAIETNLAAPRDAVESYLLEQQERETEKNRPDHIL